MKAIAFFQLKMHYTYSDMAECNDSSREQQCNYWLARSRIRERGIFYRIKTPCSQAKTEQDPQETVANHHAPCSSRSEPSGVPYPSPQSSTSIHGRLQDCTLNRSNNGSRPQKAAPVSSRYRLRTWRSSKHSILFPSWEWKPAHGEATEDGTQMRQSEFAEPKGLAGAIVKMARDGLGAAAEQPGPHGATVYYIVESLEMTEKRVNELGGSVIQAKTTESAHGSLMKFSDPEGKQFGCYEVVRR